jgi:hypothetical protein
MISTAVAYLRRQGREAEAASKKAKEERKKQTRMKRDATA